MNFRNIFGEEDINEKIISIVRKTPFLAVSLIIHLGVLVILMSIKFSGEVKALSNTPFEATIASEENNEEEGSLINEISDKEIEMAQSQKFETHHELLNVDFNQVGKVQNFDNLPISKESPIPCVNVACEEAEHNESANDDPIHHTIKGEGLIYGGRTPLKGKGSTAGQGGGEGTGNLDVIGIGGGSGGVSIGMFGGRFGGKKNLIARGGGDPTKVETLVVNALKWLARHQHKDGYWDGVQFSSYCGGVVCGDPAETDTHNVGLTGLALLAFLGYGITPQITINQEIWKNDDKDKYIYTDKFINKKINVTDVVKKGLLWLKENQTENGCYVKDYELSNNYMYDHSIATLAMAEACGLTENRVWCDSARKGAEFLIRAKRAYEGWRYVEQPKDWDVSVTGWAMMALKSAKGSKISVKNEILESVFDKLDKRMIVDDGTYRVTYVENGPFTSCFESEINCNYGGEYAMTAVGMLIRMLVKPPVKGGTADSASEGYKILKKQAEQLMLDLPTTDIVRKDNKNPRDYYYWYYGTLALYLLDGPEGFSDGKLGYWQKWNKSIMNVLIKLQDNDSKICSFGSFPAKNDKWGLAAGRVYSTAINALTMEVYFRYKNVFKSMLTDIKEKK